MIPTPEQPIKELAAIRNILMGAEMSAYAENFKQLDDRFDATDKATAQRFAEAKADTDRRFAEAKADTDRRFAELNARVDALTQSMNTHFDRVEKSLQDHVDTINKKIAKVSTKDKTELGKMLAMMAQNLVTDGE
jgi:archaellum component FlaD/FlaE